MAREVFQRYLKLARRALSDAAATAAAVAAGISARGDPLRPLSELVEGVQRLEEEGAAVGDVIMGPSSGKQLLWAVGHVSVCLSGQGGHEECFMLLHRWLRSEQPGLGGSLRELGSWCSSGLAGASF